jgi:hypothetical protein
MALEDEVVEWELAVVASTDGVSLAHAIMVYLQKEMVATP